jgi:hypothetical protein
VSKGQAIRTLLPPRVNNRQGAERKRPHPASPLVCSANAPIDQLPTPPCCNQPTHLRAALATSAQLAPLPGATRTPVGCVGHHPGGVGACAG